jgi:hypothetical protein
MTTASVDSVLICLRFPSTGLDQSMHNPTVLLSAKYIAIDLGSGVGSISLQVLCFLVASALNCLFSEQIDHILDSSPDIGFQRMPVYGALAATKTEHWRLERSTRIDVPSWAGIVFTTRSS